MLTRLPGEFLRKSYGGVWKRHMRYARAIWSALMKKHGTSLNDKPLLMLLVEAESIINSRPLTAETISDMGSEAPLYPIKLLTMYYWLQGCGLWTWNFLCFQNNSCSWNSTSKYLLKVKDGGNVVNFRIANKDILIMLFTFLWYLDC